MDEIKAASPAPAPVENANTPVGTDHEEEMPRVAMTRRNILVFALFVLSTIAFLYLVLPRFAGLGKTWDRITDGDPWWIAVAVVLEIVSFLGYVMLFRTVFVRDTARIGWRESYQITMAGLATTRLLATRGVAAGLVDELVQAFGEPAVPGGLLVPAAGLGVGGQCEGVGVLGAQNSEEAGVGAVVRAVFADVCVGAGSLRRGAQAEPAEQP